MRRIGVLFAAALLAACSAGAPDDGTEASSRSPFRVAATATCLFEPACGLALSRLYGVDAAAGFVPVLDDAAALQAVRDGEAEIAAVGGTDPVLADLDDLVVLDDPKGSAAPDVLVPLTVADGSRSLAAGARQVVDEVADALTTEEVRVLVGEVTNAHRDPGAVARAWIEAKGLRPERMAAGAAPVTIAATPSAESRVVAAAFAQALASAEIPSSVVNVGSTPEAVLDALRRGDAALAFDWAWALLDRLSGHRGLAPADASTTVATLSRYLAVIGLRALPEAAAVRGYAFVTTKEVAGEVGLASLEDLGRLSPRRGGPGPEPAEPPELLPGVVDDDLGIGSSGPDVRRLQQRLADLGLPGEPVEPTAVFDEPTRRAVAGVQRAAGLAATGVVDAATRRVLERGLADPGAAAAPSSGADGSLDPPEADAEPDATTTTAEDTTTTTRRGRRAPTTTTTLRPGSGGVVYLVFAGGPSSSWTPQVLDLLRQAGAHATFAMTSAGVTANPRTAERIRAAGHGLAVSPGPHLTAGSPVALDHLAASANAAADRVEHATGRRPTCVLQPHGATEAQALERVSAERLQPVLWDVDPQDWRNPGARAVVDATTGALRSGDVVLLHDGGGHRAQTLTALRLLLDHLRNLGIAARPLCP